MQLKENMFTTNLSIVTSWKTKIQIPHEICKMYVALTMVKNDECYHLSDVALFKRNNIC